MDNHMIYKLFFASQPMPTIPHLFRREGKSPARSYRFGNHQGLNGSTSLQKCQRVLWHGGWHNPRTVAKIDKPKMGNDPKSIGPNN